MPTKWTILVAGDPVVGFGRRPAPAATTMVWTASAGWHGIYVDPRRVGNRRGPRSLAEDALAADFTRCDAVGVIEDNPRARRFYELAGWAWDR